MDAGTLVVIEVRNGDVYRSKMVKDSREGDDVLVAWAEEDAAEEGYALCDAQLDDIISDGVHRVWNGTIRQVWLT